MDETRLTALPPLHALRSFHAAAQCGRFRDAASALGLTESAISHQVRKLEDYLGVRLFERRGNAVQLTAAGASYFEDIDPAFAAIRRATERLAGPGGRVTLTLPTSLVTMWLIPRLMELEAALPEIKLQLAPSNRIIDLKREQIDLALRHGKGSWPGIASVHLFNEQTFPVCKTGLLPKNADPQEALRSVRLIVNAFHKEEWVEWAQARQIEPPSLDNAMVFDGTEQIIEAVAGGVGLGIGRRPMIDRWIDDGRVEAPFGTADESGYAYYLAWRDDTELSVPARQVARWFVAACKGAKAAEAMFKPAAA
ncbi:LysR substrate-binding domain-containing protein [Afifella sp. YEN Y35]|uniref:LysR substrate-binding domain-containing protein n=1 Tax=Afifella sp. YEN Y35 TaxID=3388337 RepID=UPI0039E00AD4